MWTNELQLTNSMQDLVLHLPYFHSPTNKSKYEELDKSVTKTTKDIRVLMCSIRVIRFKECTHEEALKMCMFKVSRSIEGEGCINDMLPRSRNS